MKKGRSEKLTLLMSVLMSAPGPIILAIGLMEGQSSTQLADFFRRSAELLALICSFAVYCITQNKTENAALHKQKLETGSNIFVGSVMCVCGIVMVALAVWGGTDDKGNVIGGLVIALLGMIANTLFWLKYTKLNKSSPNAIIAVQARLYRVKALVDTCVTITLATIAIAPMSRLSDIFDLVGSVLVAIYLVYCGIKTILQAIKLKTGE